MQGESDSEHDAESAFEEARSSILNIRHSLEESHLDARHATEAQLQEWHAFVETAKSPQVDCPLLNLLRIGDGETNG